MQVTRVHLLNDENGQLVWMDTTWGDIDIAMPISNEMAKCLTIDIHNQVVNGRGSITPTPWGWCWGKDRDTGCLPVPPKVYHKAINSLTGKPMRVSLREWRPKRR